MLSFEGGGGGGATCFGPNKVDKSLSNQYYHYSTKLFMETIITAICSQTI